MFTLILFIVEYSSFISSNILDMVEILPSINSLGCFYCSAMETMSKRVAFSLILDNWFRILYMEEGRGEDTP
jgi:hypothetical protein